MTTQAEWDSSLIYLFINFHFCPLQQIKIFTGIFDQLLT